MKSYYLGKRKARACIADHNRMKAIIYSGRLSRQYYIVILTRGWPVFKSVYDDVAGAKRKFEKYFSEKPVEWRDIDIVIENEIATIEGVNYTVRYNVNDRKDPILSLE